MEEDKKLKEENANLKNGNNEPQKIIESLFENFKSASDIHAAVVAKIQKDVEKEFFNSPLMRIMKKLLVVFVVAIGLGIIIWVGGTLHSGTEIKSVKETSDKAINEMERKQAEFEASSGAQIKSVKEMSDEVIKEIGTKQSDFENSFKSFLKKKSSGVSKLAEESKIKIKETKDLKIKEINDYTENMLNDVKAASKKAIEAIDAEVSSSKEKLKKNLTDFAGLKKRISKLEEAEGPSFFILILILLPLVIITTIIVFYFLRRRDRERNKKEPAK